MTAKKKQPAPVRPMRKIAMFPLPSHAARDTTNSINSIVLKLQQHLPMFGYELTENPDEAVLIVGHAGQCGDQKYVDVAHCHGLYPSASGQSDHWHWMANAGVIQSLRAAKQITVPSEWVADIIRRDMNVNPHVVGWATDCEEFQPAENKGYVLWSKTRADAVCDPTPMVELAAKAHDTLFLSTFGDNVTPNVKVTGRVPYETMRDYTRHAAVCLETTRETFGIHILESLSAGVPVLGFRHGAIVDIVEHGKTGILVEAGDINGLLDGLRYCLKHRDILGANARKAAQRYTWVKVAQAFARVYDKALDEVERPYTMSEELYKVREYA